MPDTSKHAVIFVCTGNSCRSQMAEGFLKHVARDSFDVKSAGSHPSDKVAELAIQVMGEIGINISDQYPKSLDHFQNDPFDWVITLCDHARDFCPIFRGGDSGVKKIHWSIRDPYGASDDPEIALKAYRDARDDITARILKWLKDEYGITVNLPL